MTQESVQINLQSVCSGWTDCREVVDIAKRLGHVVARPHSLSRRRTILF